jgi:hypothetical protein
MKWLKLQDFLIKSAGIWSIPYVAHENPLRWYRCKTREKNIFKSKIGKESLHDNSNDNGVRVVKVATYKNVIQKRSMIPRQKNSQIHLNLPW